MQPPTDGGFATHKQAEAGCNGVHTKGKNKHHHNAKNAPLPSHMGGGQAAGSSNTPVGAGGGFQPPPRYDILVNKD